MTANYEREQTSPGAAALTLLLGIALSAAALLYATPQGKRFLEQFAGRTEEWKAQAAAALAERRESLISTVEAPVPPEQDGRLRETL